MYPLQFFEIPTPVWQTTLCTRCTPLTFLLMLGILTIQIDLCTVLGRRQNTCKRASLCCHKKLEEIWQKRTCGSGGGRSRAGTAGMSPSPVEEFMMFLHFGAWLTWQRGRPPRLLPCKICRLSLSRYSKTKVLPFPDLPQQNWCLHLALPRVMQLVLHLPFNRDGARAMVELGEKVRDSFLTFNNMCTQNKILDKLNQNEERLY